MSSRSLSHERLFFDRQGQRGDQLRALGAEIRALRARRGLTSVMLAKQVGVSTSLISQVERGITAPSLDVLLRIARALGVSAGDLFQNATTPGESAPTSTRAGEARVRVVRACERKRLGLPTSMTYELLSPDLKHQIELIWVECQPGATSAETPHTHPGEEQVVVLQGVMHYWVDGEEYVLGAGDAITIDSRLPHVIVNRGTEPAVVIAAITPPSF